MTSLMLCKHVKTKWKLVYRAIDVHDNKFGNRWNHYQWLEEVQCCTYCGKEVQHG